MDQLGKRWLGQPAAGLAAPTILGRSEAHHQGGDLEHHADCQDCDGQRDVVHQRGAEELLHPS